MRVLGNVLWRSDGWQAAVTVVHSPNDSPVRIASRADRWTSTHPEAALRGPWRRTKADFGTHLTEAGVVESSFYYEHEDRPWR